MGPNYTNINLTIAMHEEHIDNLARTATASRSAGNRHHITLERLRLRIGSGFTFRPATTGADAARAA